MKSYLSYMLMVQSSLKTMHKIMILRFLTSYLVHTMKRIICHMPSSHLSQNGILTFDIMISSLTVNGVKALSLMQKLMMLMIIQMGILMGIPCHIPSSHLRLNICIGSFSFILVCLTYPYLATIFVLAAISFCCLVTGTRLFCSPNIVEVL